MLLAELTRTIAAHQELAYLAAGLIALVESLAGVGLIVPGTLAMFALGALVGGGALRLDALLLAAALGAVAGDGLSYWLGRTYRERLTISRLFKRHPELLARGEQFFKAHGAKSILLGRLIGPLRPIIPLVSGMLGLSAARFSLVNLISAALWAGATIIPGAAFGASLSLAGRISARLVMLLLILSLILATAYWLSRSALRLAARLTPRCLNWLAEHARRAPAASPTRRLFGRLAARSERETLILAGLTLLVLTAGLAFMDLSEDAVKSAPLIRSDLGVFHLIQGLRTPWSDQLMVGLSELGDPPVNLAVVTAVLIGLIFSRRYRTAAYWLVATAGGALLVRFIKLSLRLPRPLASLGDLSPYGFPSQHAALSLIIYGFLAVLLASRLKSPRLRLGLYAGALSFSLLMAAARLYLGAHWLSDVLGGLLLATAWTGLLSLGYLRKPAPDLPIRRLAGLALGALLVAGSLQIHSQHQADLTAYAPRPSPINIARQDWTSNFWQKLPAWRDDLAGEQEQPLSLQWAASPAALNACLTRAGWQAAPRPTTRRWLNLLLPAAISDLPLLPQLHSGQRERLLLWRPAGSERLVLRLWPSDFALTPAGQPIWVGTVESQRVQRLFLSLPRATRDFDQPLEALRQSLDQGGCPYQLRQRRQPRPDQHTEFGPRPQWSGRVLLGSVGE